MNIFIDTNVILENFLQREDYDVAHRLFETLEQQQHTLFMSSGSFYTMVFLVDRYLKKVHGMVGDDRLFALRQIMSSILRSIIVAGHDNASLLRGLNNVRFKDVEDGCQYELAIKSGCNLLLTFNSSDYPNDEDAVVKVLTPAAYLNAYSQR